VTKPFSWSFTSLSAFETCPWRYYLTKVSKEVAEPPYDHRAHGNEVHKLFENHVKGDGHMPEAYKHLWPLADRIRREPGRKECEMKVALNASLQPVAFFAKDVWFRGIFDVALLKPKSVTVLDYKTGKRKPADDQLKLFAGAAFALWPFAEKVTTGYLWLKDKKLDKKEYDRSEKPIIWQEFAQRVGRIEHAMKTDNFPKRPSGLCREWCPVGQRKCEHCGS